MTEAMQEVARQAAAFNETPSAANWQKLTAAMEERQHEYNRQMASREKEMTQQEAYDRIRSFFKGPYSFEGHQEVDALRQKFFSGAKPEIAPRPGFSWVCSARDRIWVEELDGTPWHCSVASEAYWSQ